MAVPLGLHVKEKSSWKSLQLPEDLLNEEDFSNLVDIQELTDYELVPFEADDNELHNKEPSPRKSKQSRKRKSKHESVDSLATSDNLPPIKKKKDKDVDSTPANDCSSEGKTDIVTGAVREGKLKRKRKKSDKKQQNKIEVQERNFVESKNLELVSGEDVKDFPNNDLSIDDLSEAKIEKSSKKNKKRRKDSSGSELVLPQENKPGEDSTQKTNSKKKRKKKRKKSSPSNTENSIVNSLENAEEEVQEESDEEAQSVDMSEWRDLFVPSEIMKALKDSNFTKPTVIQRMTLPSAIRDRKDILGAAETGSGKTLAFGIPLLSRVMDLKRSSNFDEIEEDDEGESTLKAKKKSPPLALILEPTRELAVQVRKHLMTVSKYTNIKFANIVGGMSIEKQRRILGKSPEVVIATPGRLWQLIEEGNEHLSQVDQIHCLVVDEADRMVEKGHYEELSKILELLNKSPRRAKSRQTFVMSATLTMDISAPKRLLNKSKKLPKEEDKIKLLIETICSNMKPKVIDLTPADKVAQTLTELRVNCKATEKDFFLYYFLCQHPGRTLVFANSKDCLRRLVTVFSLLQCSPLPLHADMHQRQRLKNLDKFSENSKALLIASDVAARGLDIPHVDHVIHYQVPRTMENYVHRSGRTARASNLGLSVMFVGPEDAKNYRKIIHGVRNGEELPLLPVEMDLMPSAKQRVNLAREIDVKEYRTKKKKIKNNFFTKAAKEMDMIIDDPRLLEDLGDSVEQAEAHQELVQMKQQLCQTLKGPLAPPRMSKYPTKSGQLATRSVVDLFTRR